jgi:threonine dehydrogenase-like Zn-dependent dehydrogenase
VSTPPLSRLHRSCLRDDRDTGSHVTTTAPTGPITRLGSLKEFALRATILYAPGDVRVEQLDDPVITAPTDAIIRLTAACVCGSDLWPYRGDDPVEQPMAMGHEYVGTVEKVGDDVHDITPGQFVVGSFFASDNTCPHCQAGLQTSCQHKEGIAGAQADLMRVPLADGTLVATDDVPDEKFIPSLLSASDVLGTAWWAAIAADVTLGDTVAVVGDGAVGLLAVLAAESLAPSGSSR